MRLSIARSTRTATRTRTGVFAAVALTGVVALLAGCSSSTSSAVASTTPSAAVSSAASASSSVDVIDQTNLLLVTAKETLESSGLVVTATDSTGQGRAIEDPTQWVVVTQKPDSGTVDAGATVVLTVRLKTDPIS